MKALSTVVVKLKALSFMANQMDIPLTTIEFSENFNLNPINKLYAFSLKDLFMGIQYIHPDFKQKILELSSTHTFTVAINGSYPRNLEIDDLTLLFSSEEKVHILISAIPVGSGQIGKIAVGIGILGLGLTGVGLLGLTATTTGLLGASLVFNSIFKHPKADNKRDENNDKRSFNHSGVINSVGSGQPVPLLFGTLMIGSLTVSEQIIPTDSDV